MTKQPKAQSREEQAKREIGHTEISRGVKWALFVVGLATLLAVPLAQTYREIRQYAEGRRASPWPQCCDIFDALPRAAAAYRASDGGWVSKVFRGNAALLQAMDEYEKELKDESFLKQLVLPPAQELLVRAGSGNEKAYVGRVTVHGPARDWSIFRATGDIHRKNDGRKHGSVPLPAEGDSPIFAGKDGWPQPLAPPPRKLGQSPVNSSVGRQWWLFYRPGIDYCTGPGFLDPRHMARRADSGTQWQPAPQPDPRAAIRQFHRQLAGRGIRLVLMPTPDKATIHPEKFSSRYEGRQVCVHNPSYRQFLDAMEAEGVLVCDVTDVLAQYRDRSGSAVYLATDTHWRPEAMELAAAELARLLEANIALSTATGGGNWQRTTRDVKNLGDIAMMLKLRANQQVFGEEAVNIRPVIDASGAPWRPDPNAEVLLLGDSFANIYSLEMMNWGSGAGLAEQLSFALNRPVDTILRNDDGAYATRELLRRELAQGEDRLAGKKVVVWQFAARELAVGDWKLLDMRLRQSRRPAHSPAPAGSELVVSGTIAAKSAAPRAGQIPYAHHIFTLDLTDLEVHRGTLTEPKIAVYLFSMRNYQNTPAFSWPVGKRVQLRLQPWRPAFFAKYGRINRTVTDDIELEHPWWGEVIE